VSETLQILNYFRGVRATGNGWIAQCPAHEDRSPSLSIRKGEDGRTLLYCHAGCSIEEICAAVEIRVSDLFSESGAAHPKPNAVREAERHIQDLRRRLTPRDRLVPITVVYCDPENLNVGIARAIALTLEGEIVQVVLEGRQ